MFDLNLLKKEVEKKGAIIDAPRSLLLVHTTPVGDGTPHIELTKDGCFYVSSERGYEIFRERIKDFDELVYRIFDDVTTHMASDYELMNRIDTQDCRRLIFKRKLELLNKINHEWKDRGKVAIEAILKESPYID